MLVALHYVRLYYCSTRNSQYSLLLANILFIFWFIFFYLNQFIIKLSELESKKRTEWYWNIVESIDDIYIFTDNLLRFML